MLLVTTASIDTWDEQQSCSTSAVPQQYLYGNGTLLQIEDDASWYPEANGCKEVWDVLKSAPETVRRLATSYSFSPFCTPPQRMPQASRVEWFDKLRCGASLPADCRTQRWLAWWLAQ